MANQTESEVIIKPKLSTSIIDSKNLRKQPIAVGAKVLICTVYGFARSIKLVKDKVRDEFYHALAGEFEATYEGTHLRTGVLYLPGGIHDMVESAVKGMNEEGQVAFAFELYAEKADNPQGYAWAAKSLFKPKETDPLEEMRTQLLAAPEEAKALPEPAKRR